MSWQKIPGWFGFSKIYDEMLSIAQDGDVLVEIGVALGRSLAYLASEAQARSKNITIYAVDPWLPEWNRETGAGLGWGSEHAPFVCDSGGPFSAFIQLMREHAPDALERVRVLRCESLMAVRLFQPASLRGVLIDGSHNYEDVRADIRAWLPKVKTGGILAGDDWSEHQFPGVCRAVREAFGERGFEKEHGDYRTTWVKRL